MFFAIITCVFMLFSLWTFRLPTKAPRVVRRRLVLETLEPLILPANFLWAGDVAGDWSESEKWGKDTTEYGVPRLGDVVILNPGATLGGKVGTNTATNANLPNLKLMKLVIAPTYTETLFLEEHLKVGVDEDNVVLGEAVSAGGMAGGRIRGIKDLIFAGGNFTWGDGVFGMRLFPEDNQGKLVVNSGAVLNIQLAATNLHMNLYNSGKVNQTTQNDVITDSNITNEASGTYTLNTDKGLLAPTGTAFEDLPKFTNSGTLKKAAGSSSGFSSIWMNFENHGTLDIAVGGVWFLGPAVQEGATATTKLSNNTTLKVTGTYYMEAGKFETMSYATIIGSLQVNGGEFTIGGDANPGVVNISNNYTQTGGKLTISLDNAQPTQDYMVVGNTVSLGGTLKVITVGGRRPTAPVTIISGSRSPAASNFTNFDLGGVVYTTDLSDMSKYKLVPGP